MTLPFVDRDAELARLRCALTAKTTSLVCVYGQLDTREAGHEPFDLSRQRSALQPLITLVGEVVDRGEALERCRDEPRFSHPGRNNRPSTVIDARELMTSWRDSEA